MDRENQFALLLHLLLKSIQNRRNILIQNLLNKHNEILHKIDKKRKNDKQNVVFKLNANIPRQFFSTNMPRIRTLHSRVRIENDWWSLQGNEERFFKELRMSRKTFSILCKKLEPFLSNGGHCVTAPLTVEKQIAVCIYKLASCAEYRIIGNIFGIHKSTVHKYFHLVTNAIIQLKDEYLKFPSLREALSIADEFEKKSQIPNIIGAIGIIHIPILPPSEKYRDYINAKGWASIAMQGLVDHNSMFLDVSTKHPGSTPDELVFKESDIFRNSSQIIPNYTKSINHIETPLFLIGNTAYPLLPWLMKPYVACLTPEEELFNSHLRVSYAVIKDAFDRLKGRWNCIGKRIEGNPQFLPKVVLACSILHNFVERNNEDYLDIWSTQAALSEKDYPQAESLISNNIIPEDNNVHPTIVQTNLKNYLKNNFLK